MNAKTLPEAPTVTDETPSATEPSVTAEIPTCVSVLARNQAMVTAKAIGTIPPNTMSQDTVAAADEDNARDAAEEAA